jgi:branched-chain amino acid transport system substrate-binding protein
MRTTRRRSLVVTWAIALTAVACGLELGPDRPSRGVPSAADPFGTIRIGPTEPIAIGTLLSQTGPEVALGQDSLHGLQLAIDYLDGKLDAHPGPLMGHDIELVIQDDRCSARGGREGAQVLAHDPRIVGVIGPTCGAAAAGAADRILSAQGVLLVSASVTDPGVTDIAAHQPFFLRTAYNDQIQAAVAADFVRDDLGATTAATIGEEGMWSSSMADAFGTSFVANGGADLGTQVTSAEEARQAVAATAIRRPDAVFVAAAGGLCGEIARAAAFDASLREAAVIGSDRCPSPSPPGGERYVDGTYLLLPDFSEQRAADFYANALLPAYHSQYGPVAADSHIQAFDAASILFDALERSATRSDDGSITIRRSALRDAIYSTDRYQGLSGTISCTPTGDCATSATFSIYRVPDVPAPGDTTAKPVFTETKALADASPEA